MTHYTVVWDESLEANFVDAWVKSDAATRAVLTDLANDIDRALRNDAELQGEPRGEQGTRVIVVHVAAASVTVFFRPRRDDQIVRVTRLVFRRAQ